MQPILWNFLQFLLFNLIPPIRSPHENRGFFSSTNPSRIKLLDSKIPKKKKRILQTPITTLWKFSRLEPSIKNDGFFSNFGRLNKEIPPFSTCQPWKKNPTDSKHVSCHFKSLKELASQGSVFNKFCGHKEKSWGNDRIRFSHSKYVFKMYIFQLNITKQYLSCLSCHHLAIWKEYFKLL